MYKASYIQNLNNDIIKHFKNIKKIEQEYNMVLKGVSRLVMLDRYSQKDISLKTLKVGDLIVTIIKENKWFPIRGIGYVKEIDWDKRVVQIQIEPEYTSNIVEEDLVSETSDVITKDFNAIEKPLEVYYEQIAWRVATALASQESSLTDLQEKYQTKFYDQIKNQKIVPAGRVLYGAGSSSKVTFFNCFVMPYVRDSRDGISIHRKEVMEIMSHGGGVGTNGSTLRPKGSLAKGVGGKSSGVVSWLNDLSTLTHLVEQGGSRRGAQMIMLADWHPDIIQFIISKMQKVNILRWLLKNSKSEEIVKEVKRKLDFQPLSIEDQAMYETISNSTQLFSRNVVDNASNQLKEKGNWIINNSDFLSGANISITLSDDFMKAVKDDTDWDLKFPDVDSYSDDEKQQYDEKWHTIGDVREWEALGFKIKTYKTIQARDLWDLICFCANYSAEPGIFFLDRANEMTNAQSYDMKVVATNPCGEQPLAPYSVCNLSAINLSKFVNKKTKEINFKELQDTIETCVRFQDNVIDATYYFFDANKTQALGERRVGLGVMGLHDMLIWAGLKYGSDKANKVVDQVFHFIARHAYLTSSNLAKEKGSFPFLKEKERFINTGYMKKMDEDVRQLILKQGIRNSHLLTIAPTGSTGTMIGVSTGLEPYYGFKYFRSGRLGKFMEVNADIVEEWLNLNSNYTIDNLPDIFVDAQSLTPEEHVGVQCVIQNWIDSSISKTVNAPKGYSVKQVQKIYQKLFKHGAKGGTVYVDGSREAQVLSLTKEDVFDQEEITLEENDALKLNKEVEKDTEIGEQASLRGLNQDRKIGVNINDVCPLCHEGTLIDSGGCATCSNCNAQLKCGF